MHVLLWMPQEECVPWPVRSHLWLLLTLISSPYLERLLLPSPNLTSDIFIPVFYASSHFTVIPGLSAKLSCHICPSASAWERSCHECGLTGSCTSTSQCSLEKSPTEESEGYALLLSVWKLLGERVYAFLKMLSKLLRITFLQTQNVLNLKISG